MGRVRSKTESENNVLIKIQIISNNNNNNNNNLRGYLSGYRKNEKLGTFIFNILVATSKNIPNQRVYF
jgi:hypothetical protein